MMMVLLAGVLGLVGALVGTRVAIARRPPQQADDGDQPQRETGQLPRSEGFAKPQERGRQRYQQRQALGDVAADDAGTPHRRSQHEETAGQHQAEQQQCRPRRIGTAQGVQRRCQHPRARRRRDEVVPRHHLCHIDAPVRRKLEQHRDRHAEKNAEKQEGHARTGGGDRGVEAGRF